MSTYEKKDDSPPPPPKRLKTSPPKSRTFRKIPVVIVDYHHEVLHFIYDCFTSRHLPLEGNTLIHFDSHPDMVIPQDLKICELYSKEYLSRLSIENWIIPGCYVGHFNKVAWIKNSWCTQLPTGTHRFRVGQVDGSIQVSLNADYFIAEGGYSEESRLSDSREICLQVVDADRALEELELKQEESFILDIDLDFFSTADPFRALYKKADCYEKLKHIFSYEKADSPQKTSAKRKLQLDRLSMVFDHLQTHKELSNFEDGVICADVLEKVKDLVGALREHYLEQEIDYMLVYNAGCTCDNDGLPDHFTTGDELAAYLQNFKGILEKLPHLPKIVTISRSSEDGYCPKDQVDSIQQKVLDVLKELFAEKVATEPIIALDGEKNWDIMKL